MKRLLSIVSVLVLVGAGCSQQALPAPFPAPAPTGKPTTSAMPVPNAGTPPVPEMVVTLDLSAAVTISSDGTFSPAVITVKKGATVTWTNTGGANVWVASNPHPTHTGYPGFDSKTDIGAGESYSFTFEKTGSWNYHNHFNPTVGGTVIVE